ncbi:MAG: divergent polysaccharide deacetylase family protein [Gemmatimonadetes bacterium]|nr:divergent polysaccharide deacetylase family protein [Gemmatimonadota bacterium]
MAKRLSQKRPLEMARKRRSLRLWVVPCVIIILIAGGLAAYFWLPRSYFWRLRSYFWQPQSVEYTLPVEEIPRWKAGPDDIDAFADTMVVRAKEVLIGLGVPPEVIKEVRLSKGEVRWEVQSRVPDALPLALCNLSLTHLAHELGGAVIEGSEDRQGTKLWLRVGLNDKQTNLFRLEQSEELERLAGRIAIVIDDFGYQEQDLILSFCELSQPITFSIFPGEKHTAWIAQQAIEKNHGVMVHLPMEPIGYPARDPGPNAIFLDYAPEKIAELTQNALASVPHAKGMNNHMGSRLTQNFEAMKSVLRVVKRWNFFFIDSVTSPESVAYAIARDMGIPGGRNAMFLDIVEDEDAVVKRLYRLAAHARHEGTVIGIGHAKLNTLHALQRMLPELAEQGFVFVLAEEAVKEVGSEE